MKDHSTVVRAMLGLHDTLTAVSWPASADFPGSPDVVLGLLAQEPSRETVQVIGRVPTPSQQFVSMGQPSMEEEYQLRIEIWCVVPGRTATQVLERIDQLVGAISDSVRSRQTGNPILPEQLKGVLRWWEIASVEPDVWGGPEGAQALTTVLVRCKARI